MAERAAGGRRRRSVGQGALEENQPARLVELDREPAEESVLPEDSSHSERQFGKADHGLVTDCADTDGQSSVSCRLFLTGCPAERVHGRVAQTQSEHGRYLHVEDGVVGPGVNQCQKPGRLASSRQRDRNQRAMIVGGVRDASDGVAGIRT